MILRFDNVRSKPDPLLRGDMQTLHKSITNRGRENITAMDVTRYLYFRPFNTTWVREQNAHASKCMHTALDR